MTLLSATHLSLNMGKKIICQDFSFTLNRHDKIGILGPNGSGKTTFLRSLIGLHPIRSGNLRLHEKPLNSFTKKELAREMGLLFQHKTHTLPQRVWEYCLLSRYPHNDHDESIIHHALAACDLLSMKKRNITELSGGEMQRVAIAALIAQTPTIYLLDEPTNHLDISYQSKVLTYFSNLVTTENKAFIMALHDINMAAKFCNAIFLFFPNGEIKHGAAESILTQENLSRLYEHPIYAHQMNNQLLWQPAWISLE